MLPRCSSLASGVSVNCAWGGQHLRAWGAGMVRSSGFAFISDSSLVAVLPVISHMWADQPAEHWWFGRICCLVRLFS